MSLTYEQRGDYACKVCGNVPDEDGKIEHGKGCYTQSEDGGGTSWVELPADTPTTPDLLTAARAALDRLERKDTHDTNCLWMQTTRTISGSQKWLASDTTAEQGQRMYCTCGLWQTREALRAAIVREEQGGAE